MNPELLPAALLRSTVARDVVLTVVALLLVHLLGRRLEAALLKGMDDDLTARHKARKFVAWGRMVAFGLAALLIWGQRIEGLGVFLGMVGAGLTLSIQETLLCIAGWMLILTRRPFDIGDRIELADQVGDVIDVRLFYFSLIEVGAWCAGEQSTGRLVHVPNSFLFRNPTLNYTQSFPFIWNEVTAVFTFESDWEVAKGLLEEWGEDEAGKIEGEVRKHLASAQEHYPIKYRNLRPIVYPEIADHGVALTLRYLCPVRRRRSTEASVAEHLLRRVAATPGVEFAYPTTRFYRAEEHAPKAKEPVA